MNFNFFGYQLSDFMLFSARAYLRLFESINTQFWPLPVVFFVLSLSLCYFSFKNTLLGDRIVALILASAWFFSGWFFIWKLYTNINWSAFWFVHLFLIQGIIFLVMGIFFKGIEMHRPRSWIAWYMFAFYLFSILMVPATTIYLRGSLFSAELFGMAPTPTVFTTVAILGISKVPYRLALQIIPLLWMLYTTLVIYALNRLEPSSYII